MQFRSLILALLFCCFCSGGLYAQSSPLQTAVQVAAEQSTAGVEKAQLRYKPEGTTGQAFAAEKKKHSSFSKFSRWKMKLPFWPRKAFLLLELAIVISLGILVGQILEVSGTMRLLAIFTRPLTWLGKLSPAAGPAFLMAFQSGAVANSMLVGQRDGGSINNRELYTSVYVVSALSLFAHLPTFVVPIGVAFGWEATIALFGVRFVAIGLQILLILLVSRIFLAKTWTGGAAPEGLSAQPVRSRRKTEKGFWKTVWVRSRRTLKRLLGYLLPTFICMALLEYYGFFAWIGTTMPGLFSFHFLPAESIAIIPAQALSLYNGAIAAANFIDAGQITTRQAVIIILFGSMVTAPVRTLRHALPTYVAILGAKAGLFMAVSAQVIRMAFLLLCTLGLMALWM
jgi:hypothetical protein